MPAGRRRPLCWRIREGDRLQSRRRHRGATDEEQAERRRGGLRPEKAAGAGRGSSQSLARGQGSIETDFLNGEIALLGRMHGVPTPANAAMQRIANRLALAGTPPGSMTLAEIEREIG
jgi:2-dehydropantoate 2-reductase